MQYLFSLLMTSLLAISLHGQPALHGSWKGELTGVGAGLELIFHLSDTSGQWACALDVPAQGLKGYSASSVIVTDSLIEISFELLMASYEGRLVTPEGPLVGKWFQSGQEIGLRMDRVREEDLGRPQDPKRPFPYAEVEVQFPSVHDPEVMLSGTLTFPKSSIPRQAVVLISGSGPQNRNEELMGHRPFLVLSDALSRGGFAVLRYDDRGVGQSTGNFSAATTEDFAHDAHGALKFLREQEYVAVSKVGLIGHSEGGMIAEMLAADQKTDFIILMAAPGLNCDDLLVQQVLALDKMAGLDDTAISQDTSYAREVYRLLKQTPLDQPLDTVAMRNLAENYYDLSPILRQRFSSAQQFFTTQLTTVGSPWFHYFIQFEPARFLRKVRCPVLALNGGKDIQVFGQSNLEAIKNALMHKQALDLETRLFPNLNHLFQPANTGAISEYSQIEITMDPDVIETITQWLAERQ